MFILHLETLHLQVIAEDLKVFIEDVMQNCLLYISVLDQRQRNFNVFRKAVTEIVDKRQQLRFVLNL